MSQCLFILAAGERLRILSPNLLSWQKSPGAMFKATGNGSIPRTTISLVQLRAGQIVGNTCHTAAQTGNLRKAGNRPSARIRVTSGKVPDG
jgi:hypothetical protein